MGWEPMGVRAKEGHGETTGELWEGRRGSSCPTDEFLLFGCRRVSASSKTHPRPRKGPQTCQEEVTDSRFVQSSQWRSKLWAGHL